MRQIVVAFCLVLTACGGAPDEEEPNDPAEDNHGFGYQFDAQGPRGLKLRYEPRFAAGDALADPAGYERAFDEVQRCMGLTGPVPPFVIIEPSGTLPPTPPEAIVNGLYYSNPPLIRLDEIEAFRHEAVHYLLELNTGDPDGPHRDERFTRCGTLGRP